MKGVVSVMVGGILGVVAVAVTVHGEDATIVSLVASFIGASIGLLFTHRMNARAQ